VSAHDVVVVGGGIAGASVACELAAHGSVALVEQEPQLAHHTTGRSAAVFAESYEAPEVRALTRAARGGFALAAEEAGTPILTPRPTLLIAGPEECGALQALAASDAALRALDAQEALELCPVLRPKRLAGAAIDAAAQDIDVLALHQHFVRVGRSRGLEVRASSRLTTARRVGDAWVLTVGGETLHAALVVDAAGAWADDVAQRCGVTPLGMRPLRRTAVVARTAGTLVDPAWPFVMDVADRFYFRPEGPHVLCSPEDETPSPPCDARPEETDVALILDRVNAATNLGLRSVVSAWAGLRTFSPDRLPVVGRDVGVPGFVWLVGQGGFGIMTAPAMARLGAAAVLGAEPFDPALAARLSPARFTGP